MAAKKKAAAKKAAPVKDTPAPAMPTVSQVDRFMLDLADWLESLPPEVNDDRKARLLASCRALVV
jgi:hypothetical protein